MEGQKVNEEKNHDRFTSFMFGPERDHQDSDHQQNDSTSIQPTIDYEELMVNIDMFMKSMSGLKPLFDKVYPLFGLIWKKK